MTLSLSFLKIIINPTQIKINRKNKINQIQTYDELWELNGVGGGGGGGEHKRRNVSVGSLFYLFISIQMGAVTPELLLLLPQSLQYKLLDPFLNLSHSHL